jgi:hypothetical protein
MNVLLNHCRQELDRLSAWNIARVIPDGAPIPTTSTLAFELILPRDD